MGRPTNGSNLIQRAVGECPEVTLDLGSAKDVRCLLDTGAQVSTITQRFYNENLSHEELIDVSKFISIKGAQGLAIPYCGYVELTITALGRVFHNMGFLVVKDPPDFSMGERKKLVPGVIGSNVLRDMKRTLQTELGGDYQEGLKDEKRHVWTSVFALYEEITVDSTTHTRGKARIAGNAPVLLQKRCTQPVVTTVAPCRKGEVRTALFEEIEGEHLPRGVKATPSFLRVTDTGTVTILVTNFSDHDVYLQPRMPLGVISDASEVNGRDQTQCFHEEHRGVTKDSSDVKGILERMEVGDISPDQKAALQSLLLQYSDVFSQDEDDIGLCQDISHRIYTKDDIPVKVPHRRIPPHHWQEVQDYLQQCLDKGVIRESFSPYAAPVVLVRKKDGKLRLCVDYRALNTKTHKDAYPLPRIEEALEALRGAQYFCSLDLAHGFHQIPVAEEDVPKTAFRVGTGGLYEFLRMPFGLCNAPATFMRLMDKGFGDQNFRTILTYLDDILVFGKDFDETLQRLDMVLNRLRSMNLKVKIEKCHLFKKRLRYLGHMVEEGGISPDPDKVQAIKEWETPKTETQLRSFLGLAGYYRRFVREFASIAAPLHALLNITPAKKKGSKHKRTANKDNRNGLTVEQAWDEDCDKAFEELKRHLMSEPLLGHPDFTKPFILETDASFQGLGAILSQKQNDKLVVLGYASRGLRPHERNMANYSSMKLELLALYWSITEKFRDILLGAEFTVFTDNNPLSYLQTTAKLGATEMRWQAELAQFNFRIQYRSGKQNLNADALSRKTEHGVEQSRLEGIEAELERDDSRDSTMLPSTLRIRVEEVISTMEASPPEEGTSLASLPMFPKEEIAKLQQGDPVIGKVLSCIKSKERPRLRALLQEPKPVRKLLRQWERLHCRRWCRVQDG